MKRRERGGEAEIETERMRETETQRKGEENLKIKRLKRHFNKLQCVAFIWILRQTIKNINTT